METEGPGGKCTLSREEIDSVVRLLYAARCHFAHGSAWLKLLRGIEVPSPFADLLCWLCVDSVERSRIAAEQWAEEERRAESTLGLAESDPEEALNVPVLSAALEEVQERKQKAEKGLDEAEGLLNSVMRQTDAAGRPRDLLPVMAFATRILTALSQKILVPVTRWAQLKHTGLASFAGVLSLFAFCECLVVARSNSFPGWHSSEICVQATHQHHQPRSALDRL